MLKTLKTLLETRLETNMKKEADKINEKTVVEARLEDWNRQIKEVKWGKDNSRKTKNIC